MSTRSDGRGESAPAVGVIPQPLRDALQRAILDACRPGAPSLAAQTDAVCAVIEAHCEQVGWWDTYQHDLYDRDAPGAPSEPVFRWLPSPRKDTPTTDEVLGHVRGDTGWAES